MNDLIVILNDLLSTLDVPRYPDKKPRLLPVEWIYSAYLNNLYKSFEIDTTEVV